MDHKANPPKNGCGRAIVPPRNGLPTNPPNPPRLSLLLDDDDVKNCAIGLMKVGAGGGLCKSSSSSF